MEWTSSCQMCALHHQQGPGKAFCRDHCTLLEDKAKEVPTGLVEFLQYCTALQNCMLQLAIGAL